MIISSKCFEKGWIADQREKVKANDPGLLEKCIFALELLGRLSGRDIDFVFKGGTSLLLLLDKPRRLSVDIDIATLAPANVLDAILPELAYPPFKGCEEDIRGEGRLPRRRHFKFYYQSQLTGRESNVLLDILEEENRFPETALVPIRTSFIEIDELVSVRVPSIECLAGDKLTAFAPTTVGVPLNDRTNMQVVKQVFDLGELFNAVQNLEMVKESHAAVFAAENGYRKFKFTLEQSISDTVDTAAEVCQINLKGAQRTSSGELMQQGISRLANHLLGGYYRLDDAKVSASKSALLAVAIAGEVHSHTMSGLRFDPNDLEAIRSASLSRWPILNRLKQINPEAFFYWYMCEQLTNERQR